MKKSDFVKSSLKVCGVDGFLDRCSICEENRDVRGTITCDICKETACYECGVYRYYNFDKNDICIHCYNNLEN